jgi:hypothetical protein
MTAGCFGLTYVLGPGQMPPQGQKALVRALFRVSWGGPNVSCVLFDRHPGEHVLAFRNDGGDTAVDLRCVVAGAEGPRTQRSVGDLPPAESASIAAPDDAASDPLRCVWICRDGRGRLTIWSYDGRRKRLSKRHVPSDDACFDLMYS